MQALAKLVNNITPDLVLFVGEALVGNDGVDQLSEFNKVRVLRVAVAIVVAFLRAALRALPVVLGFFCRENCGTTVFLFFS